MAIDTLPIFVHAAPSFARYAVSVDPVRTRRTHAGAVPVPPATLVLVPPLAARYWNTRPLPGVTNADACCAPAPRPARIMTPALVHTSVLEIDATRATISPSPDIGWYTKWNASAVPQISVPDPLTVNVPALSLALPGTPTAPTSVAAHGAGREAGSPPTVIVALVDGVAAPALSVARAVNVKVPPPPGDHTIVYGAAVDEPMTEPLARKSTRDTVPSASDAVAEMVTVDPASNTAPFDGCVSVTDGGWFDEGAPAGCVTAMVCRPIVTEPVRLVESGLAVVPTVTKPSPVPDAGATT